MLRKLVDREPRYSVRDETLNVVVEANDTKTKAITATLVDLSCGGAKLRVADEIKTETRLNLRIAAAQLNSPIEVAADVCWTRVAVGSEWWLGCSFEPRIPVETLQRLAEIGTIDRRIMERLSTKIDINASYDVGTERIAVKLTDLSATGFCLKSPRPVAPNSRVLLRIDAEVDGEMTEQLVVAKSRWQIEADEDYVIGCEFSTANAHFAVRRLHNSIHKIESVPFWKRLLRIRG